MKFRLLKAVALLAPPLILALPVAASPTALVSAATPRFVAGLAPHRRPAGAPVIREFAPGAGWRTQSLTGVSEPIPASLGFLERQGAWYTPFNLSGVPGCYDLRGWHHGAGASDGHESDSHASDSQ